MLTDAWCDAERKRWADFLRSIRDRQQMPDGSKLTETEVARRLRVRQSTVSKYERADSGIDLPELPQIATALESNLLGLVAEFETRA